MSECAHPRSYQAPTPVFAHYTHDVLGISEAMLNGFKRLYSERRAHACLRSMSTGRKQRLVPNGVPDKRLAPFVTVGPIGEPPRPAVHFTTKIRMRDCGPPEYST